MQSGKDGCRGDAGDVDMEMADLAGELRHPAASEKGDLCGKSR